MKGKRRMKGKKKKNYGHYLLKYLLIAALLAGIVCFYYVKMVCRQLYDSQEALIARKTRVAADKISKLTVAGNYGEALRHCIGLSLNCDAGKQELILLTELRNFPLDGRSVGYVAIEDVETGEMLYEEKPGAILRVYDEKKKAYEDGSLAHTLFQDDPYDYYYCDDEEMEEIYQKMELCQQRALEAERSFMMENFYSFSGSYSAGVRVINYYIKGDHFLPGKVTAYSWKNIRAKNGAVLDQEFQEEWETKKTPGADYLFQTAEKIGNSETLTASLLFLGMQKQTITAQEKAQAYELFHSQGSGIPAGDNTIQNHRWEKGIFLPRSMSFSARSLFADASGKVYRLMVYEKIDHFQVMRGFWENQFQYIPIILLIVAILAWIEFSRSRYRLMTSGYREMLMDSMAHDLKSPLTAISGYMENLSDILITEQGETSPKQIMQETLQEGEDGNNQDKMELAKYYMNQILGNVDYMNSIVTQNLEILKYDKQKRRLDRHPVDLRKLFEEAFRRYQDEVEKKCVEVLINGELTEKGDQELLQKAVDNLVTNAIRYTQQGGKITLELQKRGFQLTNTTELEYGKRLNKLWEPFVRGQDSRSGPGTGLGLAIVANVFDRHNWKYQLKYESAKKEFGCIVKIPVNL